MARTIGHFTPRDTPLTDGPPGHAPIEGSQDGAARPRPSSADTWATAGGPLLLVDDLWDTGWTPAMTARLLRRAGAQGVFPLVLAVQA
ncbi:phosphoribosyltransferase [Streptomyces sp. NPDC002785]|uniref:phosphoribosyltransferase n=1 Tax=Streptomyces sp. NPDC002785 TaxID=3154543 RepID=UPI0033291C07